jgi:hypothetical protein
MNKKKEKEILVMMLISPIIVLSSRIIPISPGVISFASWLKRSFFSISYFLNEN